MRVVNYLAILLFCPLIYPFACFMWHGCGTTTTLHDDKSSNVALINVAQYDSVKPLIYKGLMDLLHCFCFVVTVGYRILLLIVVCSFR